MTRLEQRLSVCAGETKSDVKQYHLIAAVNISLHQDVAIRFRRPALHQLEKSLSITPHIQKACNEPQSTRQHGSQQYAPAAQRVVPRRHDESASELAESKKKSLLRVADSPRIGPRHDQCKSCEQTAAHACTVGCSESARLASQRGCIRLDLTSRIFLPCEAGGGHHINPSTIRRRKLCLDKKTPQYGSTPAGLGGGAGRGEQALSFTRKSRRVLENDTEGRHCPPSVFRVDGPSQLEPQAAASCWWWW